MNDSGYAHTPDANERRRVREASIEFYKSQFTDDKITLEELEEHVGELEQQQLDDVVID